jgi:hypothetical protein
VADGSALFNRPGPRLVDTLELLAHLAHPELAGRAAIPFPRRMSAKLTNVSADGLARWERS